MARADRLREIGGFDPDLRALIDWECVLRLAPLGPIAFVDEPLALQRFSQNSITRDRARKLVSQIRVVEKHADLFASRPKAHARHLYIIAGGQRQAGDLAARARLARPRPRARPRQSALLGDVARRRGAGARARTAGRRPPDAPTAGAADTSVNEELFLPAR